jgi:hypothetical protein
MDNNFIHPETKRIETTEGLIDQRGTSQEQVGENEGRTTQINTEHDAGLEAARKILDTRPNNEVPNELSVEQTHPQNSEAGIPHTEDQFKANLNAVFGGDSSETKRVLDASQMDVPQLAGLIKQSRPPHIFENVDPSNIVEALGNAVGENRNSQDVA